LPDEALGAVPPLVGLGDGDAADAAMVLA